MAGPASPQRLDRVRGIYDAIVAGDVDRVMDDSAEGIEWRNPPDAIEPGTRRGRADFAHAVEAISAEFAFDRLEILDSVQRGDAVAARIRIVGAGKASGAPIDTVFSYVFEFDGESVTAFAWSRDPDAALQAVGADRWPGDEAGS